MKKLLINFMSFHLTHTPSLKECSIIAKWIYDENKTHWPHMIPTTPKNLLENIRYYGWLVAKHETTWKVAGMVKLSLLHGDLEIYEWWSLFVMPEFRWQGLWHTLIHWIVEKFRTKSLLMVTNVPHVIHVSSCDTNQYQIRMYEIWKRLLQIIEWPQALLPNDRIFLNRMMRDRIPHIW